MSIRFATPEDLPAMLSVYGPYVRETAYSFEYEPPHWRNLPGALLPSPPSSPGLCGRRRGRFWAAPFTRAAYSWCAEVSIYLAPQIRGRGIGKALYAALEDLLDRQGYHLVYAIVTSQNAPSLAFHQAVGYRVFAQFPECAYKFGRCYGITWLEKRLKPVEIPSNFPFPITDIVKNDRNLL